MASLYGNQYAQAFVTVPNTKIAPGDVGGLVRTLYFDYTITAAPTAADVIYLGKIPKGARVIDAHLAFPDCGSTGTLEFGWAASAELSAGVAVEAASASGLMAAVDINTAAAIVNMADVSGAAVAGYLKDFSAEVDAILTVTTAWTVTSGTIKGHIQYVIV